MIAALMPDFVSRAGLKLEHALQTFGIDVAGKICADLGSNVGGFVDCMLQRGALKIYSIDTGYGVLDWNLRKNPHVVVMERTNAVHVTLPEPVQIVTIDVAWTKQRIILPAARRLVSDDGSVITLIKPHYEADAKQLRKGVLQSEYLESVVNQVKQDIERAGFAIQGICDSPILGGKGNAELLAVLAPV